MFKVTFAKVQDVFSFVEKFGSTAGLWKMNAIDHQSMEVVDAAVRLTELAQGNKIHLRTLSDTYCDNNGHRQVEMFMDSIDVEFGHDTVWVEVRSCYGIQRYTMKEYFEDVKENADHIVAAIDACFELKNAAKYYGKIR
jgi:hypothetical protein